MTDQGSSPTMGDTSRRGHLPYPSREDSATLDHSAVLPAHGGKAMREEVERFLDQQGRKWTLATVDRYRWYLRNLDLWLHETYSKADPVTVTEGDLRHWLDAHMNWAPTTQFVAVVAARNFFRWELGRERSPAERLPLPRRRRVPHRTLDETKLDRLLQSLDTSSSKGVRDTAIIVLLLDTGIRSAELCRLQLRFVELEAGTLSVRKKGGDWKSAVFCPYTAATLASWLRVREGVARPDVAEFFVGIGGKTSGRKLTTAGLRSIFRQLGQKVGFHFSPHDFRRTGAHMAIRAGCPSRPLEAQLGLESERQIKTYTMGIDAEDFRPYSPVERLMSRGSRVKERPR